MKQLTLFLIAAVASTCCWGSASVHSLKAQISTDKRVFVVGKDEVNITFTAVNDSKLAVPYASVRDKGVLVINGQELRESSFIFENGIHSQEAFIQPGKTCSFVYQLTEFFKKSGSYEVIWKGPGFQTKPLAFRVVEAQ